MASIEELVQAEDVVTIGSERYTLRPLVARDYATIKTEIRKGRPDPIEQAKRLAEGLTPDERREIFRQAYDAALHTRDVTARELDEWMASLDGAVFCFWLSVQKAHPDVSLQRAWELMETLGQEALREVAANHNGMPKANPTIPATTEPLMEAG
jgi:hypothetical protein